MARIYSVQKGWMGDNREIIAWEMSRFGDAHDAEMEQAVSKAAGKISGDGNCFCVGFSPDDVPRLMKPEHVQALRIRNMKRRAARLPLFSAEIEEKQMQRSYFSIEDAEQAQKNRKAYHEEWASKFWDKYNSELEVCL